MVLRVILKKYSDRKIIFIKNVGMQCSNWYVFLQEMPLALKLIEWISLMNVWFCLLLITYLVNMYLSFSSFSPSTEIEKYEGDELKKDGDTKKYLDIISNKNIKLSERVLIPVQQYPKVRNNMILCAPFGTVFKSSELWNVTSRFKKSVMLRLTRTVLVGVWCWVLAILVINCWMEHFSPGFGLAAPAHKHLFNWKSLRAPNYLMEHSLDGVCLFWCGHQNPKFFSGLKHPSVQWRTVIVNHCDTVLGIRSYAMSVLTKSET